MNQVSEILLRVTTDHNLVREWELVLLAQGLSPSVRPNAGGVVLSVPEAEADRARAALLAYDNENAVKGADRHEPASSASLLAGGMVSGIFILVMFCVTTVWFPTVSWFERGGADADRILHGELWRTMTALTLHADFGHAVSNAVAAAIFLGMVCSLLGLGLRLRSGAARWSGRESCQRVFTRLSACCGRSIDGGFWCGRSDRRFKHG